MKTAVVVLSGGMDSAVALGVVLSTHVVDEVCALTFNYGSKHNDRENESATQLAAHYGIQHTIVQLPFVNQLFKSDLLQSGGEIPEGHYEAESMKRTVVPMRNGIMLAIAAGYADSLNAEFLVIGNHAGDHAIYPDCRKEFMAPMEEAISRGTTNGIYVFRPFERETKANIVRNGIHLKVPFEKTWSCYKGGEIHCGRCGTCVERILAFKEAGKVDPVPYADPNYALSLN